jgi:polyisoprenoid-binding protein YceI
MRVAARCLLRALPVVALVLALSGCAVRPNVSPVPAERPQAPAPHEGAPYDIVAAQSLLTVLVYRAGTLASVGHNHVIASHQLTGTFYVPADLMRASFEVHIPLDALTVDEQQLRARELSPDFPPDVPDSAREGTRRNMLGTALLDSAHFPEIVLRTLSLEARPAGAQAAEGSRPLLAHVECTLRGQQRAVTVPVSYRLAGGTLEVSGQFPLRQSDLGLTPFTAMLGALAVQDEMRIRISIVARAAGTRAGAT